MAWTDERITMLKTYWEEGKSASQIAELMGENLSRNAVIGKAHRLGLASRPSPLKQADAKAGGASVPEAGPEGAKAEAAQPAEGKTAEPAAVTPAAPRSRAARPAVKAAAAEPVVPVAVLDMPVPQPLPVAARPARVAAKGPVKGAKVTLLDLNDRICKWPIGHPDEADFHFCGKPVSPGFPYCGEHCLLAYQAQMPRRDRPAGPSRPFGPNLPRPR